MSLIQSVPNPLTFEEDWKELIRHRKIVGDHWIPTPFNKKRKAVIDEKKVDLAYHVIELTVGPLPKGVILKEKCGFKGCFRPKHLRGS